MVTRIVVTDGIKTASSATHKPLFDCMNTFALGEYVAAVTIVCK